MKKKPLQKLEEMTISGEDFGKIVSLTSRQLRDIAKQGYFPPPEHGRYRLEPAFVGFLKYRDELEAKGKGELGAVQLARLRDKARRDRVAADLAEGKVIDRDQCKRSVTRYVTAVRNRVLGLAKRNAQRLAIETDPIAVDQHLEAETRAILTDLKFEFGLLACPNCGKEVNL